MEYFYEPYTIVYGLVDGVISVGVCHPPFEPRLVFGNLEQLEAHVKACQDFIPEYKKQRAKLIPEAFRELDKEE